MEVLQNYKQVVDARKKLKEKNISFIDSAFIIKVRNLLRKLGLKKQISIGDVNKSWDVLSFIQFIEKNVSKNQWIKYSECYCSEFVFSLLIVPSNLSPSPILACNQEVIMKFLIS